LSLHRHIERGGWLVADDECWFGSNGTGDRDPLALSSGEFVREFGRVCRIETDEAQQFLDTILTAPGILLKPEHSEGLCKYPSDSPAWIETCVGILEDHLDPPAELLASG
jgi:hypothetical protein